MHIDEPPPLLLLGGTFDPVHYGHLRLARDVAGALAPVELRLVPARDPPHRGAPGASAADRLAMLRLAVREFPGLGIDTRELERAGKSFTVLTLEELRAEIGPRPIGLIVGADAFLGLPTWHRWTELFALAHLVVVERPGTALATAAMAPHLRAEWERRRTVDTGALRREPAGAIVCQPVTPQPISATDIRAALRRHDVEAVRGLLPADVLTYIEAHRLYGAPAPDAP